MQLATNTGKSIIYAFLFWLISFFPQALFASENQAGGEEEEPIADIIKHHVADNHDWHIFDIPKGDSGYMAVAIHLPWFFYEPGKGFQFFGSTEAVAESNDYVIAHDNVYKVKGKSLIKSEELERLAAASPAEYKFEINNIKYIRIEGGEYMILDSEAGLLDFSITKTSLHIFFICLLLFFVFTAVAKGYRNNEGKAPSGIQSFFEPVILFVKTDIVQPYLGKKTDKYMPYMLTLFFFIFFSNLFGLVPWNSNIAGNTSVTAALAMLTFLLTMTATNKHYWQHIFWFPGVPVLIRVLIMLPIEVLGIFTKPFALAIRLFANISGGHFMVLALVCLIFIMGENGKNMGAAMGIAPMSYLFTVFIYFLELLVAGIQAYVFALLSAVFISQAMEGGHEESH